MTSQVAEMTLQTMNAGTYCTVLFNYERADFISYIVIAHTCGHSLGVEISYFKLNLSTIGCVVRTVGSTVHH